MVESVIGQFDPLVVIKKLNANWSKVIRVELVAAFSEQGWIKHVRELGRLKEQVCQMTAQGF